MISANTKFILSTSGRVTSLQRYKKLLQDILQVDIAYIAINSGNIDNPAIDPKRFIDALRGMPCIGGAISRDIKQTVVPFLDELDDIAKSVQSVNTVVVLADGRLKGYNTDALGFRTAIMNGLSRSNLQIKNAVCYGYGGVASVVVTVLKQLGYKVYLSGRNLDKAVEKGKELEVEVWSVGTSVDLFINATPASEYPLHEAPNLLEIIQTCKAVFDHEMPGKYLLEYCDSNGIFHIKGTEMYYPQMFEQWKLFLNGIVDPIDLPGLLSRADSS